MKELILYTPILNFIGQKGEKGRCSSITVVLVIVITSVGVMLVSECQSELKMILRKNLLPHSIQTGCTS